MGQKRKHLKGHFIVLEKVIENGLIIKKRPTIISRSRAGVTHSTVSPSAVNAEVSYWSDELRPQYKWI